MIAIFFTLFLFVVVLVFLGVPMTVAWIIVIVGGVVFWVGGRFAVDGPQRLTSAGLFWSSVCPFCGKHTKAGADVCHHCGRPLLVAPAHPEDLRLRSMQDAANVAMARGDFDGAESARLEAEQLVHTASRAETVREAALLAKRIAEWETATLGSRPPRRSFA